MIVEIHIKSRWTTIFHEGVRHEGYWNENVPQEQQDEVMDFARSMNVGRTISSVLKPFSGMSPEAQASRITIEI